MGPAPKKQEANGEPRVRTPQQARSRRTRARVLEAAVEIFEERGYDDATTAEIARRAKVAVGSVYGYFPDKRAILLEIVQETFARSEMEIIEALAPELWLDGDMREKVRALEMLTRNSTTNATIEKQFSEVMEQMQRIDRMTDSVKAAPEETKRWPEPPVEGTDH